MFKRVTSVLAAALFAVFVVKGVVSPAFASTHPLCQWVQVDADNDPSTPPVSVYGYWTDVGGIQVLIVCDPKTDEPVRGADGKGIAYINQGSYVTVEEEVVTGYEEGKEIDFDTVKTLQPLSVSVFAPNVSTGIEWDWDWFKETGEIRFRGTGYVQWPGDYSWEHPVTDPSCWLIVAEVSNPNPFPIKGNVCVQLKDWRDQRRKHRGVVDVDKKVLLGAGETKYVLLHQGSPPDGAVHLLYGCEDGYYWSRTYIRGGVAENRDPEFPGVCRPNIGFRWDPSVHYRMPASISVSFSVEACERISGRRLRNWTSGTVRWEKDGTWRYYPKRDVDSRIIDKIEGVFNDRAFQDLRWTNYGDLEPPWDVGGMRFYRICSSDWETFRGGSYSVSHGPGPVLSATFDPVMYQKEKLPDTGIKAPEGEFVGWDEGEIPLLLRQLVFLERYAFVPVDSPEVGVLTKEVIPGELFWVDNVGKPYFRENTTLVYLRVQKAGFDWVRRKGYKPFVWTWDYIPGEGWIYRGKEQLSELPSWAINYGEKSDQWWRFEVNLIADIDLVNPAPAAVTFSRARGWDLQFRPACKHAAPDNTGYTTRWHKGEFRRDYTRLPIEGIHWSVSPSVLYTGQNSFTVSSGEALRVANGVPVKMEGVVGYYREHVTPGKVLDWAENTLLRYVAGQRQACFNGRRYYFSVRPSEKVASLASMWGKYRDDDGDIEHDLIGFYRLDGSRDSYRGLCSVFFNDENPTEGLLIAPSDALYSRMRVFTKTRVNWGYGRNYFWPYSDGGRADPPYLNEVH